LEIFTLLQLLVQSDATIFAYYTGTVAFRRIRPMSELPVGLPELTVPLHLWTCT